MMIASLLVTGCAVALPGSDVALFGYTAASDDGSSARRVVLGADLDLTGGWSGLRLGWSDLSLATPARSAGTVDAREGSPATVEQTDPGYAPPLGLRWQSADGRTHRLGWVLAPSFPTPGVTDPYFVAHTFAGLSLDAAPESVGLQFGLVRLTVLAVPPGDGAWMLSHIGGRSTLIPLNSGGRQ